MALVNWVLDGLRALAGLILPMFVRPRLSPGLLWGLHLLLLAAVLVGLWFLQRFLKLTPNIGYGPRWLAQVWLPVLFLLTYLLAWAGWWLWRLLQEVPEESAHPDIDEAWDGIVAALDKAGINPCDVPVFLVVGRLAATDDALFATLGDQVLVSGVPSPMAPVRAYATRFSDQHGNPQFAVYVTCPGVTLLNSPKAGYAEPERGGPSVLESLRVERSVGIEQSVGMDGMDGDSVKEMRRIMRQAQEQGRGLTEDERRRLRSLSGASGSGPHPRPAAVAAPARSTSILQDAHEVARQRRRVQHLCRRISRTRWPDCPVNGLILLVSATLGEKDEVAQQLGLVARHDLQEFRTALRMSYPVHVLIGDLEALPGYEEFLARFPRKDQRLGKGFPLNPDLPADKVPLAVEGSVDWVFKGLLPFWAFKLCRLETPNQELPGDAARANGELFQFFCEIRERAPRLAGLVRRAVVPETGEPALFGGCYLAGTNRPEAGFLQEALKKIESTQGYVVWADEAFAEDARCHRLAATGYLALGVLVAAVVALAVYVWGIRPQL